jgi:hypothetical protein
MGISVHWFAPQALGGYPHPWLGHTSPWGGRCPQVAASNSRFILMRRLVVHVALPRQAWLGYWSFVPPALHSGRFTPCEAATCSP